MTIEQFLSWQIGQEQRYELVGGQPLAMAGAKLRHDRVTGNAFSEVRRQLRANGSPCDAFTADIGIRTQTGNIRRPDVSVLCPPFDEEAMTSDSPRLVIEVLSESTERVDRLVKLDEYKASRLWPTSSSSRRPGSRRDCGSGTRRASGAASLRETRPRRSTCPG